MGVGVNYSAIADCFSFRSPEEFGAVVTRHDSPLTHKEKAA